jgi:hypothetical protein
MSNLCKELLRTIASKTIPYIPAVAVGLYLAYELDKDIQETHDSINDFVREENERFKQKFQKPTIQDSNNNTTLIQSGQKWQAEFERKEEQHKEEQRKEEQRKEEQRKEEQFEKRYIKRSESDEDEDRRRCSKMNYLKGKNCSRYSR